MARRFERAFESLALAHRDTALNILSQASSVDASWYLLRLNATYAQNPEVRWQVDSAWERNEKASPLEQAFALRVSIHGAADASQRLALIEKFCTLMATNSAPETLVIPSQLGPAKVLPGCYRLETSSTAQSLTQLILPFDSVVKSYGEDLNWSVGQLDASIFDLSAYATQKSAIEESPPEEANALAVPLLVGLKTAGPTESAPDEITFFPLHIILRQAQGFLKAQSPPHQGRRGGNLKLILADKTKVNFMPSFISFGGVGQSAVPPLPGGHGDESILSVSRVEREFYNWNGPHGEAINFVSQLNPRELKDLWIRAKDKGGLPTLIYSASQTLSMLQPEQREKIRRFCQIKGYPDPEIEKCFFEILIPKAEHLVREQMDGYQSLSPQAQDRVPPAFDGRKIFALPSGAGGLANPNGLIGERGSLWVEFL